MTTPGRILFAATLLTLLTVPAVQAEGVSAPAPGPESAPAMVATHMPGSLAPVGVTTATIPDGPSCPEPSVEESLTCDDDPSETTSEAAAPDLSASSIRFFDPGLGERAAICRLRPECSTNQDCDALCGAGLGRCGHSTCPVRVCRCR